MKNFDYFRRVSGPRRMSRPNRVAARIVTWARDDMYIAFKMSMPELVRRDREPMSLCSLPFADSVPAASQVCQFASVEVSDMMGTERQNIHKDMQMTHVRWADRASCAHHRGSTSG
jgi:hypothetical protein